MKKTYSGFYDTHCLIEYTSSTVENLRYTRVYYMTAAVATVLCGRTIMNALNKFCMHELVYTKWATFCAWRRTRRRRLVWASDITILHHRRAKSSARFLLSAIYISSTNFRLLGHQHSPVWRVYLFFFSCLLSINCCCLILACSPVPALSKLEWFRQLDLVLVCIILFHRAPSPRIFSSSSSSSFFL